MNIRTTYTNFIKHRGTLVITLLIFVALRTPWVNKEDSLELWGSMLIQIGIAISLLYFTQRYVILREKTLLPAFFYLLLAGTNPLCFYDLKGSIATVLLLLCFRFLFDTYQNPSSQRNVLTFSFLLTLGSFYWAPLLLFLPLFWYGMYRFKSLNFKTFFASVLGLAGVWIFWLTWSVYKNDGVILMQILSDLKVLWDFRFPPARSMEVWATEIFLGILFVLSSVKLFMTDVSEKTQAKIFFEYLSLLTVVVYILSLIQSQWEKEWLLILYVPLSILLAHYFTLSNRTATMWIFLLTLVFFLLRFAYPWFSGIGN